MTTSAYARKLSRKTIDDDAVCRLAWRPTLNSNVTEETQTVPPTTAAQFMRYQACQFEYKDAYIDNVLYRQRRNLGGADPEYYEYDANGSSAGVWLGSRAWA